MHFGAKIDVTFVAVVLLNEDEIEVSEDAEHFVEIDICPYFLASVFLVHKVKNT